VYRSGGAAVNPAALAPPATADPADPQGVPAVVEGDASAPEPTFAPPAPLESPFGDDATEPVVGLPPSWVGDTLPRFNRAGGAGGASGDAAGSDERAAPESGSGDGTGDRGGAEGTPGVAGGAAGLRLPAPVYPRESRRRGEQGTVVLDVDVSADGAVTSVRVIDSAGYPRLAAAAVEALKGHVFPPATRGGRAVPCTLRIPFRFRLSSRP
jgi:protein TonB